MKYIFWGGQYTWKDTHWLVILNPFMRIQRFYVVQQKKNRKISLTKQGKITCTKRKERFGGFGYPTNHLSFLVASVQNFAIDNHESLSTVPFTFPKGWRGVRSIERWMGWAQDGTATFQARD